MKKKYLECGKIINIHGFRGTVKLESWCDSPAVLAGLPAVWFLSGENYLPKKVRHASVFREFVLMDLDGVESEDAAKALRGTVVFAAREDLPLPEGSNFIADLIGLPVLHADTGERIGVLSDVRPNGANDLYTVRTPAGEFLVPAVPAFVPRVEEDAIYLRPIPGLLENGEAGNDDAL